MATVKRIDITTPGIYKITGLDTNKFLPYFDAHVWAAGGGNGAKGGVGAGGAYTYCRATLSDPSNDEVIIVVGEKGGTLEGYSVTQYKTILTYGGRSFIDFSGNIDLNLSGGDGGRVAAHVPPSSTPNGHFVTFHEGQNGGGGGGASLVMVNNNFVAVSGGGAGGGSDRFNYKSQSFKNANAQPATYSITNLRGKGQNGVDTSAHGSGVGGSGGGGGGWTGGIRGILTGQGGNNGGSIVFANVAYDANLVTISNASITNVGVPGNADSPYRMNNSGAGTRDGQVTLLFYQSHEVFTKIDGEWLNCDLIYTKVDGEWKEVNSVYAKVNNVWKPVTSNTPLGVLSLTQTPTEYWYPENAVSVGVDVWSPFMKAYAIWSGVRYAPGTKSFSTNVAIPANGTYTVTIGADDYGNVTINSTTYSVSSNYRSNGSVNTISLTAGNVALSANIQNINLYGDGSVRPGNPGGIAITIKNSNGSVIWDTRSWAAGTTTGVSYGFGGIDRTLG